MIAVGKGLCADVPGSTVTRRVGMYPDARQIRAKHRFDHRTNVPWHGSPCGGRADQPLKQVVPGRPVRHHPPIASPGVAAWKSLIRTARRAQTLHPVVGAGRAGGLRATSAVEPRAVNDACGNRMGLSLVLVVRRSDGYRFSGLRHHMGQFVCQKLRAGECLRAVGGGALKVVLDTGQLFLRRTVARGPDPASLYQCRPGVRPGRFPRRRGLRASRGLLGRSRTCSAARAGTRSDAGYPITYHSSSPHSQVSAMVLGHHSAGSSSR